jgi:hypothetical protein
MIRSSSGGVRGFACETGAGSRFKMASKMTAAVEAEKAHRPVVIS